MFFTRFKNYLKFSSLFKTFKNCFFTHYSSSQILMENLDDVYFLINSKGIICNKSNQATKELFNSDAYKKKLHEILPIKDEDRLLLTDWYNLIFDKTRNFNDMALLAPKHILTSDNKHLKIKYLPVYNTRGDQITWIICKVTNQTALQNLKNKRKEEQNYSKMIKLLLKNQEGFKKFIEETPQHINNLKNQLCRKQPNFKKILKDAHTLKGTAASYYFVAVSDALRKFENLAVKYNEQAFNDVNELLSSISSIEKMFQDYINDNADIFSYTLSMVTDGKFIKKDTIGKFLGYLNESFSSQSSLYQLFLNQFVLENITSEYSKFRSIVESIAEAQDKKIHFIVKPSEILIYPPYYHDIYESLIHVIRNAIDHGIETNKERETSGKTGPAQIMISFEKRMDGEKELLEILISDNGRGVKRAQLLAMAKKMGLPIGSTDFDLYQIVFKHGVTTKMQESDLSGKGIGLSIFKEKVENLGGKIIFKSIENEGSSLIITLPLITSPVNAPSLKNAA